MTHESLFAADVQAVETALDRIGYMAMTSATTADNVEAIRVPAYRALRGIVVKHNALVADLAALQDKFDHLESEWVIGRDRGDSVVYRSEREEFDAWQRQRKATGMRTTPGGPT
jgi:hypothetical protein